jgi:hypothetical protein
MKKKSELKIFTTKMSQVLMNILQEGLDMHLEDKKFILNFQAKDMNVNHVWQLETMNIN